MTCLNDDFDITAFPCNLMQNLKNREIFKNRSHITNMLKIRGVNLKAKRKIIITANTPLFYIFGYVLQDRPWLTYEEQFCNY